MATSPIDYLASMGGLQSMPGSYDNMQIVKLNQLRNQLGQQQVQLGQQQIDANTAAQAQQQQYSTDVAAYAANPTANGAASLLAKYPGQKDAISKSWATKDEATRQADLRQIGAVHSYLANGKVDAAIQEMQSRIDAERNAGQDTSDDERIVARLKADPSSAKAVQAALALQLASVVPDKFGGVVEQLNKGDEGYTLGPGSKRFDSNNNEVASAPVAEKTVIKSVRNGDGSTSLVQVNPDGSLSSAPHPVAASGDQIEQIALAAVPGATVTSRARTPEHNAEVGGKPNSYHLSDQARDLVPPQGMSMADFYNQIQAVMPGMKVLNEGDHVHIQPSGPAPRFSRDGTKVLYTSTPKAAAATNDAEKLSDEALSTLADQYLAGDKSVFTNLGRGAQGGGNVVRLRNMIAAKAKSNGMSGSQVAAQMVDFAGSMAASRAAGTSIANIEQASIEAAKLIPLALQASDAIPRSQFVPFARAQQMVQAGTNNVALRKFVAANNALVNVYSRAINPKGTPTVADKEHARDLLNTGFDQASYRGVVEQMQKEIQASREAPKQVRADIRAQVSSGGNGGGQPPAGAVQMLKGNPGLRGAFDAKYGKGAAARVLGG